MEDGRADRKHMTVDTRTFIIRRLSEREADGIAGTLHELEREGHQVADVRHEGDRWCVYAYERRFRGAEPSGILAFRRRTTD